MTEPKTSDQEQNVEKEIKRISLALYQITNKLSLLEISDKEKKDLIKSLKEQDKKILKLHNVKFSEKDKKNLSDFLN